MTGITIFMMGTVAVTNVGLLFYLLSDRKKTGGSNDKEPTTDSVVPPTASQIPKAAPAEETQPSIGKSKTDPGKLAAEYELRFRKLQELEDKVEQTFQLMEQLIGEVREKDVEFAKEPEAPESSKKEASARMSKEEEETSFEDARIDEFDSDTVSAPAADGASMDEIEESFNTAKNHENASSEEQAKAGKILDSLMDTYLMDMAATNKIISDGVQACLKESYRLEFADKNTKKVRAIQRDKTTIFLSKDFKDFNPADLLS